MEPVVGMLLILVAVIVAVAVVAIGRERRRTRALARCAEELGFRFRATTHRATEADLGPGVDDLMVFSRRDLTIVYNTLTGLAHDTAVFICDSKFSTGTLTGNSWRWRQTVLLFRSLRLQLPPLSVRPKRSPSVSSYDTFPVKPGFLGVGATGHRDFDSTYELHGADPEVSRALFGPSALGHFRRDDTLCVDGVGDRLALFRPCRRVKPQDVRRFLEEGFQLFAHLAAPRGPGQ